MAPWSNGCTAAVAPCWAAVLTCRGVAAASFVLLLVPGCGDGPVAVADWRMADRTVDRLTDQPLGAADLATPDGFVDDYDNAQGALVRGVNGNISTKFPADRFMSVAVIDPVLVVKIARSPVVS